MSAKLKTWEAAVSWLMRQPDKQELVLDCYYDESINDAAERYWKSEEWNAVKQLLPEELGSALDLGAGRGIASYALAKEGWNVLAVEPDQSDIVGAGAIRLLQASSTLPIKVISEFGESIQSNTNSIDLFFARQVLHHADNLNQLCAEAFRVLKPGGTFIAVRDHVISSKKDMPRFFDKHPLHHLYGGENAYKVAEYLDAMTNAGFHVKQVIRPFDSVINYAPYTKETLKEYFITKCKKIPGIGKLSFILKFDVAYKILIKLLTVVDRRPGRLYSFVCVKPEN